MPAPPNDRLSGAILLPVGQGYGVVEGTCVEATSTPDEPWYYPPDPEYQAYTVFYTINLPAGVVYVAVKEGQYTELVAFIGEPSSITNASNEATYSYADGPSWFSHPGGFITFMVNQYSYGPDWPEYFASTFTFAWGHSVLDTNPAHWSETTVGEWKTYGPLRDPAYPLAGQVAPFANCEQYVAGVYSTSYEESPDAEFFYPIVGIDAGQEACAHANARRGAYATPNEPCSGIVYGAGGPSPGGIGSLHGIGEECTMSNGGTFHSGVDSKYVISQAFGGINVGSARTVGSMYSDAPADYWGPHIIGSNETTDLNEIRNLTALFKCRDEGFDGVRDPGHTGVEVRALLPEDRSTVQPAARDTWVQNSMTPVHAMGWQDADRDDQPLLATFGATDGAVYSVFVEDPLPLMVPVPTTATYETLLPIYMVANRTREGLHEMPLSGVGSDQWVSLRAYMGSGSYYYDGVEWTGSVTVEYRVPEHRWYLGFPFTPTVPVLSVSGGQPDVAFYNPWG